MDIFFLKIYNIINVKEADFSSHVFEHSSKIQCILIFEFFLDVNYQIEHNKQNTEKIFRFFYENFKS